MADVNGIACTDRPSESQSVSETRFHDNQYQAGKVLTYQVTAVRRMPGNPVLGVGPESITVAVENNTAPAVPTGLDIVESDMGGDLTWNPNQETDLAGYHVFRSESANGGVTSVSGCLVITHAFPTPSLDIGTYLKFP